MTHLLHIITGLQRGGAETVLVTLATQLAQTPYNYKQSVIYFKDGPLRAQLEKLNITCYKASYVTAFGYIKRLNPDIIHSSLWSANIIARLYGSLLSIPVYCALHTVSAHSGKFRNFIDILFPLSPTYYIAVSGTVKDSYARFLPAKKITVISNGIPANPSIGLRMSGSETSGHIANLRVIPDRPVLRSFSVGRIRDLMLRHYTIGSVGRFVPVKNYHILLEAFAHLHKEFPSTKLILVGHGPLETALRTQAENLSLSNAVTFIINQPAQPFYAEFDCFVQPSQHEGLSIALLEALQSNLPVIVTGHNATHACIKHKQTGLIIEPGQREALYRALKYYILNPAVAADNAQAGKEYVQKHFSAQAMAKKYHELFNL